MDHARQENRADIALSMIIPTFNRAELVRTCLLSLRTSGAGNYEVIVVDDGSSDNTAAVVAATEPNAIYLRQSNQGPAAARNNGFRASRGRYLCFLDCDDEWLPNAAQGIIEELEQHPDIDVLFADAQMGSRQTGFQSWIDVAGQKAFFELPNRNADGLRILEREPFLQRMLVRNCVFLGSTLIRRSAFERFGPFDPELCGAADWNLWLRLAAQTTFAFHPKPLAIYTKHSDGMSNDADGMSQEFCMALQKLTDRVELTPDSFAVRNRQLRHHLFNFAYRAYQRGDYRTARERFRQVLSISGWEWRSFLYYAACSLPFGAAGCLRWFKQVLTGSPGEPVVETAPASKAVVARKR